MFARLCSSGLVVGTLSLAPYQCLLLGTTDSFWKALALSEELLASEKNPFTVILGPPLAGGNTSSLVIVKNTKFLMV